MRKIQLSGVLLAFSLIMWASTASADTVSVANDASTVTVTGHADISLPPDVAYISAEVVTNAPSATDAASKNDVIEDHVADSLAALHLGADAVHQMSYRSIYVPQPKDAQVQDRYGYIVTRLIEVQTSPDRIDEVTRTLTKAGVDSIDEVRTDRKDHAEYYRTLYRAALKDADEQAHTIASSAQVKILRIRSVDATQIAPFRPLYMAMDKTAAALPPPASVISSTLTVTYDVAPFPEPGYIRNTPKFLDAKGTR